MNQESVSPLFSGGHHIMNVITKKIFPIPASSGQKAQRGWKLVLMIIDTWFVFINLKSWKMIMQSINQT